MKITTTLQNFLGPQRLRMAEPLPRGWGAAYYASIWDEAIIYRIPLNVFAAYLMAVYIWLRTGLVWSLFGCQRVMLTKEQLRTLRFRYYHIGRNGLIKQHNLLNEYVLREVVDDELARMVDKL